MDLRLFIIHILLLNLVHFGKCRMTGKIIGGHESEITEFPYSAFLKAMCVNKYTGAVRYWICGASILNQLMLLTAAHCVLDCARSSYLIISVGHSNTEYGTVTSVESYIIHNKHREDVSLGYDIALVKVKTPLKLSSRISRIALWKSPPYFEKAQVAGWGVIHEDGTVAEQLKFVNQYVWRRNECLRLLEEMPRGTICASSGSEEDYIAEGDSGSALVARGYVQLGIVSYKRPAKSRSVVIYTDVGYFYDWIKQNAKLLYCDEGIRI
ncbi:chymotrypsin-1-like isoform X1 [Anticarsia gemmatalis]|uniref:chymotrypsin-1-like isoform X1 n=1 Tax=Anticarsia gemmatalis TaxID=129554 RepID=UPI003F7656F2